MNTLYLSPTGISLSLYLKRNGLTDSPEDLRRFLSSASEGELKRASAELNSLFVMGVNRNDRVVFLASDTDSCEMVAGILKGFLADSIKCEVLVKRIAGLQTDERKRFDREGITNLTEEVVRQIEDYRYSHNIVINATAGYKATIPYLTLIGMIFQLPIRYLFESSPHLIDLPPLPLQFDLGRLEQLSPILDSILYDYCTIREACDTLQVSEYSLRNEYSDLILEEEGLVRLRPTGRILYLKYLHSEGFSNVMASPRVHDKLKSGQYDRSAFMNLFRKMKDPVYLKSKLHNEVKQAGRIDLDCFKQGNTSERIFFFTRDKSIFLGDIFLHDEYERFIATGRLLVSELEREQFVALYSAV